MILTGWERGHRVGRRAWGADGCALALDHVQAQVKGRVRRHGPAAGAVPQPVRTLHPGWHDTCRTAAPVQSQASQLFCSMHA